MCVCDEWLRKHVIINSVEYENDLQDGNTEAVWMISKRNPIF